MEWPRWGCRVPVSTELGELTVHYLAPWQAWFPGGLAVTANLEKSTWGSGTKSRVRKGALGFLLRLCGDGLLCGLSAVEA